MKPAMRSSKYSGDPDDSRAALAGHWEQARPAVFAFLTATIYDFHRAEDLLQEVAVAVASQYHEYDRNRSFLAWAMGIARNRTLLYFREQARDRQHFSDATVQLLSDAAARVAEDSNASQRDALRHCLTKTVGRRRRILDLRYSGGLSIAEIATQLDTTSNAVKIALHRVRLSLEQCIRRRVAAERGAR